jgi:hypothetical protein
MDAQANRQLSPSAMDIYDTVKEKGVEIVPGNPMQLTDVFRSSIPSHNPARTHGRGDWRPLHLGPDILDILWPQDSGNTVNSDLYLTY